MKRGGKIVLGIILVLFVFAILSWFIPSQESRNIGASKFTIDIGDYKFSEPFPVEHGTHLKCDWSSNREITIGIATKEEKETYQSTWQYIGGNISFLTGGVGKSGSFEYDFTRVGGEYVWVLKTEPTIGELDLFLHYTITTYPFRPITDTLFLFAFIVSPILGVGYALYYTAIRLKTLPYEEKAKKVSIGLVIFFGLLIILSFISPSLHKIPYLFLGSILGLIVTSLILAFHIIRKRLIPPGEVTIKLGK